MRLMADKLAVLPQKGWLLLRSRQLLLHCEEAHSMPCGKAPLSGLAPLPGRPPVLTCRLTSRQSNSRRAAPSWAPCSCCSNRGTAWLALPSSRYSSSILALYSCCFSAGSIPSDKAACTATLCTVQNTLLQDYCQHCLVHPPPCCCMWAIRNLVSNNTACTATWQCCITHQALISLQGLLSIAGGIVEFCQPLPGRKLLWSRVQCTLVSILAGLMMSKLILDFAQQPEINVRLLDLVLH